MYKDILRSIAGIDVFPVISLCLFLAVFAVVVVWTWRLDRERLAHDARLPLDSGAEGSGHGDDLRQEGAGR